MKVPTQIYSSGIYIKVLRVDGLAAGREDGALGLYDGNLFIIKLDKMLKGRALESTFLHEILEHINDRYELNLEHRQITCLEASLYSILKDNALLKG